MTDHTHEASGKLLELADGEMRFFSDYGKYGRISITLPPFIGDEPEFDAEFDEIMSFMTTIMKRRKAALRAQATTGEE